MSGDWSNGEPKQHKPVFLRAEGFTAGPGQVTDQPTSLQEHHVYCFVLSSWGDPVWLTGHLKP